jgi:hypothetical protein
LPPTPQNASRTTSQRHRSAICVAIASGVTLYHPSSSNKQPSSYLEKYRVRWAKSALSPHAPIDALVLSVSLFAIRTFLEGGRNLGRICVEGNEARRVVRFVPWSQEARLALPINQIRLGFTFRSGSRRSCNHGGAIGSLRRTRLVERLKETGETRNVRLTQLFAHFAGESSKPRKNKSEKKRKKMANVGIEPKTFALLARRSNQLS